MFHRIGIPMLAENVLKRLWMNTLPTVCRLWADTVNRCRESGI
jgi:hypothetical protein